MATHLETGRSGEAEAFRYIQEIGYKILEVNWRYKHLEVDIIAMDGDVLVFIEVKTRKSTRYGQPFEAVGYRKQQQLNRAANLYISYRKYQGDIRFDIVSILSNALGKMETEHIEDAFWPE